MKKISLNRVVVLAMSIVMAFGCINVPTYAITNGWQNATEVTGRVDDDVLESATDENWYKFTTTVANTICTLSLYDEPTVNAYNMELRYQETAGTRPIILENTTNTTVNAKSYIRTTLENVGTYYVRVYSLTGEYDDVNPYTMTVSCHTSSFGITMPEEVSCDGEKYDWVACAEMLAKDHYKDVFGVNLTIRNYKNAARFIQSSGLDDDASRATATRSSLTNTALAANYIFAGDYIANPIFKTTNELVTAVDFQKQMWVTNGTKNPLPVIVQMRDVDSLESDRLSRYLIVKGVDHDNYELTVVDPDMTGYLYISTDTLTFKYNEFYQYNNEAIILA